MARKLLYVIADGGRARFVEQSADTGAFVTIEEMDNTAALKALRDELRSDSPGRTHESQGDRRSAVGPDDLAEPLKEAFMVEVAKRAGDTLRRLDCEGFVVAAPSQLIGELRDELASRAMVVAEFGKDLTKAPDHDLGAWFSHPQTPHA